LDKLGLSKDMDITKALEGGNITDLMKNFNLQNSFMGQVCEGDVCQGEEVQPMKNKLLIDL
jgi:hypothetical protein